MPVKVFWGADGRPYAEAETAAEALELIKLGSNGFGKHAASPESRSADSSAPAKESIPERVKHVFSESSERALAILKVLIKHPDGITGEVLAENSKQKVTAFGGILGAVTKAAWKYDLKPEQFFSSEQKIEGSRRYRTYWPGKLLVESASLLVIPEPSGKLEVRKLFGDREEEESRGGRMKSGGGA